MANLIIAYIKILIIAFLYSILTGMSFGSGIALSYITAAFLMFAASVIRDFSLFNIIYLCFILIVLLIGFKKKKLNEQQLKSSLNSFMSPGLVIFTILFFYLYSIDRHQTLSMIDDFLRWGGMVRDCMNNNVLYSRDLPVMIKPGIYPPFTTLISVFFNKSMQAYNESWSLFGIGSFCISLMMPTTERLKWKKEHILFIIFYPILIIMALLCIQMDSHMQYPAFIFNSTYVDWVMSLMTAFGLYQVIVFNDKSGDYLSLALTLSSLILVDRISLAFVMLIVGAWLLRLFVMKELGRRQLFGFAASVMLSFAAYAGWKYYSASFTAPLVSVKSTYDVAKAYGGEAQNSNAVMMIRPQINTSYEIDNDEDIDEPPFDFSEYREDTKKNYLEALHTEPVMTRPFNMNYYVTVVIITVLLFGFGVLKRNLPLIVVAVIFLLGSAAYAVSMMYGYMYYLSEYEAVGLAAYGRYMQTYTYVGLALLFLCLMRNLEIRETVAAAMIACLCIEPLSISTIMPKNSDSIYRAEDRKMLEYYIGQEYQNEPLLVINQTDMAYRQFIKYLFGAYGGNVSYFQGNKYINSNLSDFTKRLDVSELILIADFDDYFYDNYWSVLTDETLQYSCIYRIIKKETGYDFEPVYQWYSPQWE